MKVVYLKNLIQDSSFENDKWTGAVYSRKEKLFNNRSLYFKSGTTTIATIEASRPILNHKYYGRRYIKTAGENQPADARFEVFAGDGEGLNWVYAWNKGNFLEWTFESTIHEITVINYEETTSTNIRCFNVNTTVDTWIDGLMLIDLTDSFGAGNEPTLEWCNNNIPYIENELKIFCEELDLVFDRNQNDLIKETEKAFYNANDLNRVEIATEYIEKILTKNIYFNGILAYKQDWTLSDFPTEAEMNRYLENIQKLIDSFYLKKESPKLPNDMNYLDIYKANDIEKILNELNVLLENMISQFYYSNEIFCGEVY